MAFGAANGVLSPADVTLHGATVGDVAGSLIWHADTNTLSFIKTGGILANDTYTVTVLSGPHAVHDAAGHNLDGNGDLNDTQPNDNYTNNFTVNVAAATRVLSTADIARGPSQPVDDNPAVPGSRLAISLSDATGVVSITFDLHFDPTLLSLSGASLPSGFPENWALSFGKSGDGDLTVTISGATPLSGTNMPIALIDAFVLNTATYGASEELSIDNIGINTKSAGDPVLAPAIGDTAVHVVAFLGDADGSGIYTGFDAAEIARVANHTDTGFHAYPKIDPVIIGNVTGTGTLSATDAADVAQKSVGLPRPEIPDLPQPPATGNIAGGGSAAADSLQTSSVEVQASPPMPAPIAVATSETAPGSTVVPADVVPPPSDATTTFVQQPQTNIARHPFTVLSSDFGSHDFSNAGPFDALDGAAQNDASPRNLSFDEVQPRQLDRYYESLQFAADDAADHRIPSDSSADATSAHAAAVDACYEALCIDSDDEFHLDLAEGKM